MPASVPTARRFVRATLREAGLDADVLDRAELLVSEMATSAVVFAHSGFEVRVVVDGHVSVEVHDTLPSLPAAPDRSGEPKLSLYLLDAMADRWGWEPLPDGKRVWCEITQIDPPGAEKPA